ELRAYAANCETNTDDRPIVVFEAPHLSYRPPTTSYDLLARVLAHLRPEPQELIAASSTNDETAGGEFVQRLSNFITARDAYLRGLMEDAEGHRPAATEQFLQSAALSGDFTLAYAQCLSLATQQIQSNPAAARGILERLSQARPERPVARQLLERMAETEGR